MWRDCGPFKARSKMSWMKLAQRIRRHKKMTIIEYKIVKIRHNVIKKLNRKLLIQKHIRNVYKLDLISK